MEIWQWFWIIALAFGFIGFCYVSFLVVVRGLAEAKSLLEHLRNQ